MVELYCNLIRKGLWTIDRVPIKWRQAVTEKIGGTYGG